MDPPSRPPRPALARGIVVLLCLLWGSTWIVIQGGLRDLPPLYSAGVRFAVSGAVMAVLAARLARREGGGAPPTWLWIFLGTFSFAVSYGIVYRTETVLPSGLTSLLWAVFPLLMALCSHLFLPGERLRPVQGAGFALGFAGVALLLSNDVPSIGAEAVPAALLLFLSPLVSAVGTLLVKLHGSRASSLVLNRNAMLVGAAWLLLGAALFERDAPAEWTLPAVASVLYLALFGTVATFGLYFWLLRHADAHKLSLIAYVTPAVAVSLGTLVGDEPFTWSMALGAILVLLGVGLVVRRQQSRGSA